MGQAHQLTGPSPWDLSCPDWEQRLRDGRSLVPDLPLDRARADQAVGIFKKLRIPDVPGTPTLGDAAGQWILDIVAAMFGAYDVATATRMIRGLFLLTPKKSAKTTYGGAIMLVAMVLNRRPLAELLLTAPSHEISDKAFSQVAGMIALDDEGYLQKRFHARDHIKTIECRKTKAKLKIKTFDASIVTGAVPAAALIDEVHLLGGDAQAEAIIAQLVGGMVSVPEAFWGMITTQSFRPPQGIFKSELQVARGIRDGRIRNVDTLSVLYEFSEAQQKDETFWKDPAHWPLITPNLNRSVWLPTLIKDFDKAVHKGADALAIWASQHLNIEIGLGLHSGGWAGAPFWERRGDPKLTLEELLRRSEIVTVGVDGGGLDDLLGLGVIGRDRETKAWLHWGKAWAHRSVLERRKDIAAKLLDLEKAGDLTIPERLGDDVDEVVSIVCDIYERKLLPEKGAIGVDPVGIDAITTALDVEGIRGDAIVGVSQGWRLSGTIKSVERRLAEGSFLHGAQPLMAWAVGNAKIVANGNALNITKAVSGSAKIDPLMALFDAAALMAQNPQPEQKALHQLIIIG
ncbi:MAG: terminase large subunit [Rhodospirillales bacterium]|nr:terminase large subunit [Rhodospirillales bacterium]